MTGRYSVLLSIILFLAFHSGCSQKDTPSQDHSTGKQANRLINETSPYLLQHAYNPVDWYPWGKEAFEKARKENKPLIISIGYSACHWCHVMERESFEDAEIARLMNEHFISVKVDREERPDVDQIYIEAAQKFMGRAGWPLNAIVLPDMRPFFAGTYFPRENWKKILEQTIRVYSEEPEKLESIAGQLTDGILKDSYLDLPEDEEEFTEKEVRTMYNQWSQYFDFSHGGYLGRMKFPLPANLMALQDYYYHSGSSQAGKFIDLTLKKMALGGIYDHLGGGFARYSTDNRWRVPHFEKMLYDNAQLVSLYSRAYRIDGDPLYRKVVEETLEFVDREMTSKEGAFFSSLDADSEGEEGRFYVWTSPEVWQILGSDADLFMEYYQINKEGNWEDEKNVLHAVSTFAEFADKRKMEASQVMEIVDRSNAKLFDVRSQRVRPGLDNKILTSWNALMIKAYADAFVALRDPRYLEKAQRAGNFIRNDVMDADHRLVRNYSGGGPSEINGFLDDYALTIDAFITLYQADFDFRWLETALDLTRYVDNHFADTESGYYFYTSDLDEPLLKRNIVLKDNVIPASNSVMAGNLYYLGLYFYNNGYLEKAGKMVAGIKDLMSESPQEYANWYRWSMNLSYPVYEVAVVGSDYNNRMRDLQTTYIPNAIFMGGNTDKDLELLKGKYVENETFIYVCFNKKCNLPVKDPQLAISQLQK